MNENHDNHEYHDIHDYHDNRDIYLTNRLTNSASVSMRRLSGNGAMSCRLLRHMPHSQVFGPMNGSNQWVMFAVLSRD